MDGIGAPVSSRGAAGQRKGDGGAAGDDTRPASVGGAVPTWVTELLTAFAAFVMFLGPGVTVAFYLVMVGYYEYAFGSKLIFVVMLLSIYGPFPVVTLMQATFDSYFDRAFSTSQTYSFRIVFTLLVLEAIIVAWMYAPREEGVVVAIGLALGAGCAIVHASGHQLVCAIDPTKLIYSEIGNQLGSVLPLFVFTASDFQPDASPQEFRRVLLTVIVVNFVAMMSLVSLHCSAFFDTAYTRLSYDLETEWGEVEIEAARQVSRQAAETKLLDEPMEVSFRRAASSRQTTPVRQLEPEPATTRRSIPGWVWTWMACKGCMFMAQAFIVSLAGFYGDPAFTQYLASMKLASDFVGRLISFPMVQSENFHAGPRHNFLATSVVIRLVLFAAMLAQLGRAFLPQTVFVVVWCAFASLDRLSATMSDVTVGAYVEVKDRKFVSRLTFFFGFGGLLLGLGVSAAVSVPLSLHLGAEAARRYQALHTSSAQEASPGVVLLAVKASLQQVTLGPR